MFRDDVALIDTRLQDVLSRVDTGESGATWKALLATKAAYFAAPDREKNDVLYALFGLIDEGAADYGAWQDVRSLVDQRTRVAQSEQKRKLDMQQMVTIDRLMLFVSSLAQVVRDSIFANVQDREEARRALADASSGIERLISVGESSPAAGSAVDSAGRAPG